MRPLLVSIFALSGFSGLIYESIWSHYLKLLLGHAAYAQTLVLVIFMGGMALGAWFAARRSAAWRNLLLAYAAVEGLIGVAGLVFHRVFDGVATLTQDTVLPAIGTAAGAYAFKWLLAAALVLPQSVLLGMTFPLMSGALVRRFPRAPGAAVAVLYFANSAGAAAGVLASGFALIPAVGLPGTIMAAGIINVLLACAVWLLARGRGAYPPVPAAPAADSRSAVSPVLLLGAAFATGAASFMYEVGWVRMLSLVLGASTHGFELMLSAFIIGLALGSLWIRGRIERIARPIVWLAVVQAVMGVLALASLPIYARMFEVMSALLGALDSSPGGYVLFNVSSHAIALAVMLPATFCAGMTLPLITHVLLRSGYGERAIGAVYAANTAGGIVGVALAVHLLMPGLGLSGLICVGAAVDIAVAFALVASVRQPGRRVQAVPVAALVLLVLAAALVRLEPRAMASGVYRYERARTSDTADVVYHEDGRTATVALVHYDVGVLAISTNGKPDATVMMRDGAEPTTDEYTMTLLAALPLAMDPAARDVAVVGFGAGMTTHTLLGASGVRGVDTIEIEPRMIDAAARFRPVVERAFTDARSHVRIDDARTVFALPHARYDLVISEPSNPWVSGVSSLYTREFYRLAGRQLADGGIFAQWIHMLELNETLLSSIVKALSEEFPRYVLYTLNDRDLLIAASRGAALEPDLAWLYAQPGLAAALARLGVGPRDIGAMFVGDDASLGPLLASVPVPVNSDYFPVLDSNAVRARYLGESAAGILSPARGPLPIVEMLSRAAPHDDARLAGGHPHVARARDTRAALALRAILDGAALPVRASLAPDLRTAALLLRAWRRDCGAMPDAGTWLDATMQVFGATAPFLTAPELEAVLRTLGACVPASGPDAQGWFSLFTAVAQRDAAAIASTAGRLLERGTAARGPGDAGYLLAAAMLGRLALGDPAAAGALWDRHVARVLAPGALPVPSLRMLRALSLHAAR